MSALAATQLPEAAARLQPLLLERHDKPFAWGCRDCAMFAADAVHAVTGRDPAADLRGTYFSARQALRLIRSHGGLAALADTRLGERVPIEQAADGDVALLARTEALPDGALAVLWRGALIAQGDQGLVLQRPTAAAIFWRAARG